MKEPWEDEFYEWKEEIPDKYNQMYVYGIGISDNLKALREGGDIRLIDSQLMKCIRIVLSEVSDCNLDLEYSKEK